MFRIRSITIHTYKNLDGTYSFENSTNYLAIIGLNGSGKSNLLEAISIIFDKLINHNGVDIPFDYSIEYELDGHTFTSNNNEAKKDGERCNSADLNFPTSLISCYSGEDLRLWHNVFEEYHMRYFNDAVNKEYSTPSFLYVNKYCWKIALISLVCSKNPDVKLFLSNLLKIEKPEDVDISFSLTPKAEAKKTDYKQHSALRWFNSITQDGLAMINMNLVDSTDINVANRQISNEEKAKYIFNFLYILSQPKKNEVNKIDKLIDEIQITLNCGGLSLKFDDLSEGEKKLILIECITNVLGDENSLVLLDEPDAHTHIALKKDLLKLISEFDGQTIFTTHSPMFLNKRWDGYDDNNIYYLRYGIIEDSEPLKHLSDLTDNTIDYFEGSFILCSKHILVTEGPYDIFYLKNAIDKLYDDNPRYIKLKNEVAFVHAGGANNAKTLYEQTFHPIIDKIKQLVFLFDYDKEGFVGVQQLLDSLHNNGDANTKALYYQDNYDTFFTEKPNKTSSYMVEDLFDPTSYAPKVSHIHSINTHKEFRNIKKATSETIKEYIQNSYVSFNKEWLLNFKPVLDQLLVVFGF